MRALHQVGIRSAFPILGALPNAAPVFVTDPAIDGSFQEGQTLTVVGAVVTGKPTPAMTYQWALDGTNVSGATGAGLTLPTGSAGKTPSVVVTATNSQGSQQRTLTGQTIKAAGQVTENADTVLPLLGVCANLFRSSDFQAIPLADRIAKLQAVKAQTARFDMFWQGVEPYIPDGNYYWGPPTNSNDYDGYVAALVGAGIRPHIIFNKGHAQYTGDFGKMPTTTAAINAWVAALKASIVHYEGLYPNNAFIWEIGNEPNGNVHWTGGNGQEVQNGQLVTVVDKMAGQYAALLKAVNTMLGTLSRVPIVVTAGLASLLTGAEPAIGRITSRYIADLVGRKNGANTVDGDGDVITPPLKPSDIARFTGVSTHPYPYYDHFGVTVESMQFGDGREAGASGGDWYTMLQAAGFTLPHYWTEVGLSELEANSNKIGSGGNADYPRGGKAVARMLLTAAYAGVAEICYYDLFNDGANNVDLEQGYGLYKYDRATAKDAATAYTTIANVFANTTALAKAKTGALFELTFTRSSGGNRKVAWINDRTAGASQSYSTSGYTSAKDVLGNTVAITGGNVTLTEALGPVILS